MVRQNRQKHKNLKINSYVVYVLCELQVAVMVVGKLNFPFHLPKNVGCVQIQF